MISFPSHSVGSHVDCYTATPQNRCHRDMKTLPWLSFQKQPLLIGFEQITNLIIVVLVRNTVHFLFGELLAMCQVRTCMFYAFQSSMAGIEQVLSLSHSEKKQQKKKSCKRVQK